MSISSSVSSPSSLSLSSHQEEHWRMPEYSFGYLNPVFFCFSFKIYSLPCFKSVEWIAILVLVWIWFLNSNPLNLQPAYCLPSCIDFAINEAFTPRFKGHKVISWHFSYRKSVFASGFQYECSPLTWCVYKVLILRLWFYRPKITIVRQVRVTKCHKFLIYHCYRKLVTSYNV